MLLFQSDDMAQDTSTAPLAYLEAEGLKIMSWSFVSADYSRVVIDCNCHIVLPFDERPRPQ